MVDKLALTHLQSLRHPIQESKISLEIEVDKLGHKISTPPWACSSSIDIPFWEVNSVVNRLNSQQSKSQQECKCTQNIDQGRHSNITKSSHRRKKKLKRRAKERQATEKNKTCESLKEMRERQTICKESSLMVQTPNCVTADVTCKNRMKVTKRKVYIF